MLAGHVDTPPATRFRRQHAAAYEEKKQKADAFRLKLEVYSAVFTFFLFFSNHSHRRRFGSNSFLSFSATHKA